MVQLVIYMNC